jgi:hypothetical protein
MKRMSTATKILLGGGIVLLLDSFLPYWNRACFGGGDVFGTAIPKTCLGVGMWNGVGILAGILLIALLAEEGLRAAGTGMGTMPQRTIDMTSVGLALGTALFVILRVVFNLTAASFGAWLGIILALAIAYGGYMRLQESKAAPAAPPAGPPPAAAPPPPPPSGGGFTS